MDGVYAKGKEEGEWINYWDNSKIKNSATFKHGELHGKWFSYNPTGHLTIAGHYSKNFKSGKWIEYFENGLPKDETSYKVMDVKTKMDYGYMKGHTVKESIKHGHYVSYSNKDFKKVEEGQYKNGDKDGEWIDYYPGGKMPAVFTTYKKGELNGPMRQYDRMGKVSSEINYSKGEKDGKFIIYNEAGKVVKEKVFSNGIEVK
jgi:antitoxin component YwqK of YwqJK toxin-antitoxin module